MHVVHNLSLHFYMLLIIEVETLTELKDEEINLIVMLGNISDVQSKYPLGKSLVLNVE